MTPLCKGRYRARLASSAADLVQAQALRHRSFIARRGLVLNGGRDEDDFDPLCQHILIEHIPHQTLVGCYRLMSFEAGQSVENCYTAQSYDLAPLRYFGGAKLEMGRFCLDPAAHDPDILRLAWGAMARVVMDQRVELLFGCSSFEVAKPEQHTHALAALQDHIAARDWRPLAKAVETYPILRAQVSDARQGLAEMPTLLRTYLGMGGKVSDHAVIDRRLDTLHVFTAVEIAKIPPARARALRLIAGRD